MPWRGEDERRRAAGMDGYLSKPVEPAAPARAPCSAGCAMPATTPPAIDRAVLDPRLQDDEAARRDLLAKFSRSALESRHDIETAMAAGDLARAARRRRID